MCIFLHAVVLMVRGAYTYVRVPIGFELAELLQIHRNPYERIGHFFQGSVPALVVYVALAISATYELIEWISALTLGQGADEFLGTQGDPWDTQSDTFSALIGAVTALLVFSRLQDRRINRLSSKPTAKK